ncbi:MAG: hypothetical protein RSE13_12005 [Planktothrix sp. GU0601_MAG3]|nr:MAG: hypothetical protein RSE13_12005 [Planktothrix sp. GU0601_MAG3]
MNNSLKNFTVTLYSFHLRHTLTNAPDQVDKDANLLWENLIKLSEFLPFSELKELRTKLICYDEAGNNYIPQNENGQQTESLARSGIIEFNPIKKDQFSLGGNVQPFRFNDTYAVDLTLFCEPFSTSIDTTNLTYFELNHLLPNSIQGSLGQTIWLYGEAEATDGKECKDIADLCANNLLTDEYQLVFCHQGKLFKSHIFQYKLINLTEPQNPAKNCQILISINNHQADTIEQVGKISDWIIHSLCCRHKILYIYHKAEQANQTARKQYVQIEKKIEEFSQAIAKPETRLETFKEMLNSIPIDLLNYSRSLRDLKTLSTSLSTNITNYKTCLRKILTPEDQVKFWQEFGDRTCKQYQTQIEINLNYLSPGQDLLEQLINTIRGLVEIEQAEIDQKNAIELSKNEKEEAKRDQSLELTISTLGVGLGVGGIASSITSAYIEKPLTLSYLEKPVDPWILASLLSLLSIVIGAITGFITWQITKIISKEKNREETNTNVTNTNVTNTENSPCNRD